MGLDLINENNLGVTSGTDLEEDINNEFQGETMEVGLYLAMARQAQREGLAEVAEVLKTIAWEEAEHAARFAELNGKVSQKTKENIEKMLNGEQGANKGKRECALEAKDKGCDPAHDVLDESSKDEARHAQVLKGLLDRYF
ncbi:ferritin-like domain-containing protein [Sporohalobacter salinus]|uniref:ferritin-like domain-containing protein n=1 Tax=Sporohalobacter salinus TaxID=1494606 RepID=UPI001961CC6D|nr:ferritin family protein [Sporohalobacter salinus]MBM7624487.1 rubrerythrin [Sporohalobacter salinus]